MAKKRTREELYARVIELRDGEGLPFPKIAETLNSEGFRTPRGKRWGNQVWSLYVTARAESGSPVEVRSRKRGQKAAA